MAESEVISFTFQFSGEDQFQSAMNKMASSAEQTVQKINSAFSQIKVPTAAAGGGGPQHAAHAGNAVHEMLEKLAAAFSGMSGVLGEPAKLMGEFTEKIGHAASSVGSAAGGIVSSFAGVGAGIAAALGGAEIAKWGGEAIEHLDQLRASANLTAESFAQIRKMAQSSNLTTEELTPVVGRLNEGIHQSAVNLDQEIEMMELYEDRLKLTKKARGEMSDAESKADQEERQRVSGERSQVRLDRLRRQLTEGGDLVSRISANVAKFVEHSDLGVRALEKIQRETENLEKLPEEIRWIKPLERLQELKGIKPEVYQRLLNLVAPEISAKFGENIETYLKKGHELEEMFKELGPEKYAEKVKLPETGADKMAEGLKETVGAFGRLGEAAKDAGVAVAAFFSVPATGLVDALTGITKALTEIIKEANNVDQALGSVLKSGQEQARKLGESFGEATGISKLSEKIQAQLKEAIDQATKLREQARKSLEGQGGAEGETKIKTWEDVQREQHESLRQSSGFRPYQEPGGEQGGMSFMDRLGAAVQQSIDQIKSLFGGAEQAAAPVAKLGESSDKTSGQVTSFGDAAAAAIDKISQSGGGGGGQAEGGSVGDVPIMASNGEYLINAGAARALGGGVLDAINEGRIKLQDGGSVDDDVRAARESHIGYSWHMGEDPEDIAKRRPQQVGPGWRLMYTETKEGPDYPVVESQQTQREWAFAERTKNREAAIREREGKSLSADEQSRAAAGEQELQRGEQALAQYHLNQKKESLARLKSLFSGIQGAVKHQAELGAKGYSYDPNSVYFNGRYYSADEVWGIRNSIAQLEHEVGGYARGGLITGPGTATSDSIPIRASRGEYVMRASAVSHYGKRFMDAINSAPQFNLGGIVSAFNLHLPRFQAGGHVAGPAAAPALHPVTIQLPGGESVSGFHATPDAISQLNKHAVLAQASSTGRKPSWVR